MGQKQVLMSDTLIPLNGAKTEQVLMSDALIHLKGAT